MSNFLILHDIRGYLANSRLPEDAGKMNADKVKEYLEEAGNRVELKCLHDLKFPSSYKGWYVIYPSCEDPGLFYKGFIENILLALEKDGAVLIPKFTLFRAHHNKVFMELLKTGMSDEYKSIKSVCIHFANEVDKLKHLTYPVVVKTSEGSASAGVAIAKDERELKKKCEKMGKIGFLNTVFPLSMQIMDSLALIKLRLKHVETFPYERIKPRMSIVIQSFIPGLKRDYKVLVFYDKYYLLARNVRDNDFRASGSGKFSYPEELTATETQVLDFAKGAYEQLNAPMLSIDIAHDGKCCHMMEFQCVNFGPYTLQYSDWYFTHEEGNWLIHREKSKLETEFARSILKYTHAVIVGKSFCRRMENIC